MATQVRKAEKCIVVKVMNISGCSAHRALGQFGPNPPTGRSFDVWHIILKTVATAEAPVHSVAAQFEEVLNLSLGLNVCNRPAKNFKF